MSPPLGGGSLRGASLRSLVLTIFAASSMLACRTGEPGLDHGNTKLESVAPRVISFATSDGGLIYADLYGKGRRAVVLAHGGRFTKESWQDQARIFARAGFRVLAIDFRGRGKSRGGDKPTGSEAPFELDVLAAVRYMRKVGAKTVSIIGASFGGWAAAKASVLAKPNEIDKLVLMAHSAIDHPEKMKRRLLFITTRDDFSGNHVLRLPGIRKQFERAPEPKELVILEGSAHAQHIFTTKQGTQLMQVILRFLSKT